jgi:multimeric flavodoxin WrbA
MFCEFARSIAMKKVTAFVGSAHKQNTHKAVVQFLDNLKVLGDVECEIVTLSNYKLGFCRGCRVCFDKGEEFCPLHDDRAVLMDKIAASDGVIFATPVYTFQVTGIMKTFLDRFGVVCHRPRYFGKAFTSIVTQGFGGGNDVIKYFDVVGRILGFNTVKGSSITGLVPYTEKDLKKMDRTLVAHSQRFYATLSRPVYPTPSWFMLIGFRMGRTTMIETLDERSQDYRYYKEKGWLESNYFYPTRLGPLKGIAGALFDRMTPTIRKMMAL